MLEPRGTEILDSLLAAGVTHIVTVPDWIQISLHDAAIRRRDVKLLSCCTEDEAVAVAGGLIIGGKVPVVVIQNQGLYAGVNAVRAVGLDARMPIVMMIGQFGREFANLEGDPRRSERRVVSMLEPMLDCMEIPYRRIESSEDVKLVQGAVRSAWERQWPAALLVGQSLAW